MVRLFRTFSNYISSGDTRCAGCIMHRFGEVQAHRTSSNLLELHPHRASKVYRLLSQEFGVVRLDQTFSACSFTGDRSALCTSWMRFKHIEPHRTFSNYILKHIEPHQTFSNYILTEIARYVDFFHTSSCKSKKQQHSYIPSSSHTVSALPCCARYDRGCARASALHIKPCVILHLSARESAFFRRLPVCTG